MPYKITETPRNITHLLHYRELLPPKQHIEQAKIFWYISPRRSHLEFNE